VTLVRAGTAADAPVLVALFDEAVAWLAARGQTGQWGTGPFSADPARVDQLTRMAAGGGLRIAETAAGEPAGALVLGERYPWVEPAPVPELYVTALVTSRRHAGEDVGGALVRAAVAEARTAGVPLLRVDCWADAPGLVAWYERQGFTRTATFVVDGGWRGQVLSMDVPPS
jgi:ribosomal protein S18 acetylase RimI-like enzyme